MATAAPRLQLEHRRRIRAMTLWLIGTLTVGIVGVIVYALAVGFAVSSAGAVQAAAPGHTDRDLVVRVTIGEPGCEELTQVTATETRDEVALLAVTSIPNGTRVGFSCPDIGTIVYATVRLDAPLGDRELVDADRPGREIEVVESVAALVDSP